MRALLALLAVLACTFGSTLIASAHPLGNFTVNRYSRIEVGSAGVELRYVLDLAEIPTLQELLAAGLPADVSNDEARTRLLTAKAAELANGAQLALAGRRVTWSPRDSELRLLDGQGGLRTLRVELTLSSAERVGEGASLEYRDTNYAGRAGWHEIVLRGDVAGSSAPSHDTSDELRSYPADPTIVPLDRDRATATIRVGADQPAAMTAIAEGAARLGVDRAVEQLTGFLRRGGPSDAAALLAALLVSAVLGGLHALGPGHGKAMVGAYLVGSRGTARHALVLGATVTATHTAGVYLLGLVTLAAASVILPERLYPILGVVSGVLVIAIGAGLIRSRSRDLRGSAHRHEHDHEHGPHTHTHGAPSLRSVIGLGVSGGLLPCPTALVVLLAAVSFHNVALGMLLVAAFSVGLAAVLTSIGLAIVWAGGRLTRSAAAVRIADSPVARALPVLSAAAVTVAGVLIALDAARGLV